MAVVIVGLVVAGVPVVTLLLSLVVLSCPLVVMPMMGGQDQGDGRKPPDPDTRHNRGSC
ncbi:hypothetical protein AB0E01_39620 [Nocardia vinacea]|uniref:hypothetical protein n=1 Tax=Nocardia vinacea TaxID=96468 RepID=UPI0033E552DC